MAKKRYSRGGAARSSGRRNYGGKRGSAKRSVRGGRSSRSSGGPRQLKIVLEIAGQSGVARPAIPQQVEKPSRKAKF